MNEFKLAIQLSDEALASALARAIAKDYPYIRVSIGETEDADFTIRDAFLGKPAPVREIVDRAFAASGKEFFYVNTHLDHKGREARRRGLAMVLERIGAMNPKGLPMVLTGDFNVKPDDECLIDLNQVMQDARFVAKAAEKGHTFHGWGNTKSVIDYVYFSGFHHCERYHIVSERFVGVPYISDHYPVTAVLVF